VLPQVLEGIARRVRQGLAPIKINAVVVRGHNERKSPTSHSLRVSTTSRCAS
jgi:molybdenum cofactor biosynthesis enzyme MoaA